jgi:hypothetical protein
MKPRLVLLYTRDRNFDRVLKEALLGTRAAILIARNLDTVRKIVFRRGRELDLAILDFNQGFRGVTVLNAFATSARVYLSKPFSSAILASAIANLWPRPTQLANA